MSHDNFFIDGKGFNRYSDVYFLLFDGYISNYLHNEACAFIHSVCLLFITAHSLYTVRWIYISPILHPDGCFIYLSIIFFIFLW